MTKPPELNDIVKASRRIKDVATRTPLVESPALSKRFGREVYLKLECFQPIRVFKVRGAYNKISQVDSDSVTTTSSGNHGIAVAYTSRMLGKKATVVIPEKAVQEKVNVISEFGAKVVKMGGTNADREAEARRIAEKTGAAFVHPFDDPDVIAGQGTCGLEITEQLRGFDSVVVPVGGGGLISGISIAVKSKRPSAKVFGVEPVGAAKLAAALKAGHRVTIEPKSIADGLIPGSVGDLTFEVCSRNIAGTFEVTDEEILEGVGVLANEAHVFAEPSGAAPVAALLGNRDVERLGRRVVFVISGGNVSLDLLRRVLGRS